MNVRVGGTANTSHHISRPENLDSGLNSLIPSHLCDTDELFSKLQLLQVQNVSNSCLRPLTRGERVKQHTENNCENA
jgi:hypothetical protein